MLVEYEVQWRAGGYPSAVYEGGLRISLNASEDESAESIVRRAIERAKDVVAREMCMSRSLITIAGIHCVST